jgi:hypothetical protein
LLARFAGKPYVETMHTRSPQIPAQAWLLTIIGLGLIGGIGFSAYAAQGGNLALSFIESTLAWCL